MTQLETTNAFTKMLEAKDEILKLGIADQYYEDLYARI